MALDTFPDFLPKRFGLKYNPPTIVLEYLVPSTGKLYHHKMRLRNLQPMDNVREWIQILRKKHSMYLPPAKVSDEQITDLINHLQSRIEQNNSGSTKRPSLEQEDMDLNKLTPEEVMVYKQEMDKVFRENAKRPGDPGYLYDVRKEFKIVEDSGWDEDGEEEDIVL